MRKPRADSILDKLPQNQRDSLESWLLEENISYADAQKRLREDFSCRVSTSTIKEFYRRATQRKILHNIDESADFAQEVSGALQKRRAPFKEKAVAVIEKNLFDMAVQHPEETQAIFFLLKGLSETQKEQTRAEALLLAKEKFQFDAAKLCLKELPKLKAISTDRSLSEDQKIAAVCEKLFGRRPEKFKEPATPA